MTRTPALAATIAALAAGAAAAPSAEAVPGPRSCYPSQSQPPGGTAPKAVIVARYRSRAHACTGYWPAATTCWRAAPAWRCYSYHPAVDTSGFAYKGGWVHIAWIETK